MVVLCLDKCTLQLDTDLSILWQYTVSYLYSNWYYGKYKQIIFNVLYYFAIHVFIHSAHEDRLFVGCTKRHRTHFSQIILTPMKFNRYFCLQHWHLLYPVIYDIYTWHFRKLHTHKYKIKYIPKHEAHKYYEIYNKRYRCW